jgi:hypothetical protein
MARRLRVGDKVRVRGLDEILATLDADGRLDALPFMPEMIPYCEHEFTVLKRIDKINDTVDRTGLRRMTDTVILDGVRCDGAGHAGCQALCQILWKEAWLRPVESRAAFRVGASAPRAAPRAPRCTAARLTELTRLPRRSGEDRYICQSTELKNVSSYLAWWDVRQDWRDFWSGNVGLGELARYFSRWVFSRVSRRIRGGTRVLVPLYNAVQRRLGGEPILTRQGTLERTPKHRLDLQPGELVRVKSHEEIVATLDKSNKNRGLWFDVEMVKYCGGTYRVLSRVERIIDHKSGKMIVLPNECIVLDGVTTRGDHHRFYPQNEYPFWREIWMTRVAGAGSGESSAPERTHAEARD